MTDSHNLLAKIEAANLHPADFLFPSGKTSSGQNQNWRECFPEIIGGSKSVQVVLESVCKIARSEGAVLIFGESGTGKELIAAAVHRLSSRASRRFVAINCSAIPESLLESELFGHEKGAFTGAFKGRSGLFSHAQGGTLFLDEIGDMPPRLQAKLLRVLQEKKYTAVGGHELKSSDVRIIAATNVDLEKAVADGRFRLDLFYRLNVLPVTLPPLRERGGDVELLLHYFLERANQLHSINEPCFFSNEVIDLLCRYPWPGNIRELQNLVERMVVMKNGGEISVENLPSDIAKGIAGGNLNREEISPPTSSGHSRSPLLRQGPNQPIYPASFGSLPPEGINLTEFISELENCMIVQALELTQNNKNKAAKLLGLNRTTLVERIKKRKIAHCKEQ